MLGSPMRPSGRWVVDCVEIPTRPRGTKRRRDDASPEPSSSSNLNSSLRKRGRTTARSRSPGTSSHPRSLAISPPATEELGEGSSRSGCGRPSSALNWSEGPAQTSLSKASRSASRAVSSTSFDEKELVVYTYEVNEDEIEESADLEVPGEGPGGGDGDGSDDEEEDGYYDHEEDAIPVRLLDDFTIYDSNTLEVIPTSQLLEGLGEDGFSQRVNYSASGEVRPWTEDPDEAPDDELELEERDLQRQYERVKLTRITRFSVHHIEHHPVVEHHKLTTLDGKIYVCTEHAWYILGYPSHRYSPFFQPYWRMHRITHLLMSSLLHNKKMNEAMFCKKLSELERETERPSNAFQILGRDLDEADYHSDNVQLYLPSTVMDLSDELEIARTTFVRDMKDKVAFERHEQDTSLLDKVPKCKDSKFKDTRTKVKANDRDHRKNQATTYTTPIVSQISQNLFQVKMDSAKVPSGLETDRCKTTTIATKVHKSAIQHYVFTKPISNMDGQNCYGEASIEGVGYKVNEFVMVIPDPNYRGKHNYGWTSNTWGNTMWFCQLKYFFKSAKGEPMFHGQWYLHGSRTLLNELSHSQALYPVNVCDDQPLDSIYQKAHVTFLSKDDPEPQDDGSPETNNFHCRFFYHHDLAEYVNRPDAFEASLDDVGHCYSCMAQDEEVVRQTPTLHGGVLSYGGEQYHINDFVYVIPLAHGSDDKLLLIGQILDFGQSKKGGPTFTIRYHKRHIELEKAEAMEPFPHSDNAGLFFDERRLVLTSDGASVFGDICPSFLSGHCFVRYFKDKMSIKLEEWIQHDDHFWVNSALESGNPNRLRRLGVGELDACLDCMERRENQVLEKQAFMQSTEKLVGMELFAGAGGLGFGMGLSGYVKSHYAVEFMPSAAKTFKRNHPKATVICQDTNNLLRYVVERDAGGNPEHLPALDGGMCPEMPKKEDGIDFIFGGPPCQAFSRANHSRRADDVRSTMPCNMLSYVEHYQPKYFLLENVAGLLDYRFQDKRAVDAGNGAEIKLGMVKFIMRTLISLGYQVRYKTLQAAQYGVPQSRSRLIFIGAKQGLTLPEFPVPVYAFPKGCTKLSIPADEHGHMMKIPTASRWKSKIVNEDDKDLRMFHQCAPHKTRTIFDATGDLLAFDWKHPHKLSQREAMTLDAANKDRTWFGLKIPCVDACVSKGFHWKQPVGYPEGAKYATRPQNRYQQWLRRDIVVNKEADRKGKGKALVPEVDVMDKMVTGHYTNRFNPKQVERTVAVPLEPNASHRDIPVNLWPEHAKIGRKQFKYTFFGRVGGDKQFKCAMTNMAPNIKQTWPLHPLQRRIYSVRECARAQGFPDDYEFCSIHSMRDNPSKAIADQIKQIGNAVAVPFALALGKEIGEAHIADWKAAQAQQQREESPEI